MTLEVLKPFCTTLFMIAVFAFVKEVSPMTATSTVEAIFGALYFGAGRGLGGLLGGLALQSLGSEQTFRYSRNKLETKRTIFLTIIILSFQNIWILSTWACPRIPTIHLNIHLLFQTFEQRKTQDERHECIMLRTRTVY